MDATRTVTWIVVVSLGILLYLLYTHKLFIHATMPVVFQSLRLSSFDQYYNDAYSEFKFRDITIASNLYSFHNVCLEDVERGPLKKRIFVYNASVNATKAVLVGGGSNIPPTQRTWRIEFRNASIPENYPLITNHTAYFISNVCEGNLYHFWVDFAVGLFGAMKVTKRLNSPIPNKLYYHNHINRTLNNGCNSISRFEDFLFAMSIKNKHIYYGDEEGNICYSNAVFGYTTAEITSKYEIAKYMMNKFNVSYNCDSKDIKIVVQQRKTRKILNFNELLEAAKAAGFEHIQSVTLEGKSVAEQLGYVACADILVGIHGAGMKWYSFMTKPKRALLELSWPAKYWAGYYAHQAQTEGFYTESLNTTNVTLNWHSYVQDVRPGRPLSDKEKKILSTKPPKSSVDNHWKWADASFSPSQFVEKLKKLSSLLR